LYGFPIQAKTHFGMLTLLLIMHLAAGAVALISAGVIASARDGHRDGRTKRIFLFSFVVLVSTLALLSAFPTSELTPHRDAPGEE
jgi:hypothetical protein